MPSTVKQQYQASVFWQKFLVDMITKWISKNIPKYKFIECGVKFGNSAYIIANNLQRKGYLFDTWEGFPSYHKNDVYSKAAKQDLIKKVRRKKDVYGRCVKRLKKYNVYHLCKMIRGDICKTVPIFCEKNRKLKISFLNADVDLYEPTSIILKNLWPMIVNGGVLYCDDYKRWRWPGVKMAIDQFIEEDRDSVLVYVFNSKISRSIIIMKNFNNEFNEKFENFVKYIESEIEICINKNLYDGFLN